MDKKMARFVHALSLLLALAVTPEAECFNSRNRLRRYPASKILVRSYLDSLSGGDKAHPITSDEEVLEGPFVTSLPINGKEENGVGSYLDSLPSLADGSKKAVVETNVVDVPVLDANIYEQAPIVLEKETSGVVEMEKMSLEEGIAASMAKAKRIGGTKAFYVSARKNLRVSKSRTQWRLSRSTYEKEKAAEKIANIMSNMEAEVREVEEKLQTMLDQSQAKVDAELERMVELLVSEIELEVTREEQIVQLMNALQESIATKEYDIANEEKITNEMVDVRSKLKPGTVAQTLDQLVERKRKVGAIEQELVNDLFECLLELQIILEDARARAANIDAALNRMVRPETQASTPYEWRDIEDMEMVLEQAAEDVIASEKRIRKLGQQIDDALVKRTVVLGEAVPPGLTKAAQRAAARNFRNEMKLDVEGFLDLKEKDEEVLLSMLATSVSRATLASSQAAIYGLKAVLETMTGEPVKEATNKLLDEAKDVQASPRGNIQETVKSTASVLGTVGRAGSTIVNSLKQNDSTKVAGKALQKTSKDICSSVNVAAALSLKLYDKYKKRIEDIQTEAKEKAAARERIGLAGGFKRLYEDRLAEAAKENGAKPINGANGTDDLKGKEDALDVRDIQKE